MRSTSVVRYGNVDVTIGGLCYGVAPSLFYDPAFADGSYNYNIMHGFVELKIVVV